MIIKKYVNKWKILYEKLHMFIDNDTFDQDDFSEVMNIVNANKILKDPEEFRLFLHLIKKIAKHHQRNSNFFNKIEQILLTLKEDLIKNFSNFELFKFFKLNKKILLFLFENKIINVDETISNEMTNIEMSYGKTKTYQYYFYPEIKTFLKKEIRTKIEKKLQKKLGQFTIDEFEEKRQIGENSLYICQLIRNDSVIEFIKHVNQTNISLSSKISPSIFETNNYFLRNKSSLIEYAAFFGSIQIFRYLMFNNVRLKSELWICAIHSKNAELIHLLEENLINPPYDQYEECLKEAMKCHHNEISRYILDNLLKEELIEDIPEIKFFENFYCYSFHYHNYQFIPTDFNHPYIFLYVCRYNYIKLVKFCLSQIKVDINYTVTYALSKVFFI